MCTHIAGRSAGLSYQATCDTRGESAGAHAQSTIWKNRKVDYRPRKAKEAADAELAASSGMVIGRIAKLWARLGLPSCSPPW